MKHITAILAALIALSATAASDNVTVSAKKAGKTYDGTGVLVSYGKLFYDYDEQPRSEIMDYLFKPGYGASLQILKVEMGYDGDN